MRLNLLLVFFLFVLIGCGLSKEEEVDDAITQAHQLLTSNKCAEAIAVLNGVGQQTSNADWVSAMASAQACLAPWNVVRFFETDLDKISGADTDTILGVTATFSQAEMVSATDPTYTNLLSAINTILNAGSSTTVSHTNRVTDFGSVSANSLSVQALYMIINQIGQFARFYGNANTSTGTKGGGSGSNGCYIDYTDAQAQAIIGVITTDSCNLVNEGHADLNASRARRCQGIVLFNNFIDILGSVSFGTDNSGDLDDLAANINDLCDTAAGGGLDLGGTCTVKTQSVCEANSDSQYNDEHIERFYATVWESMHL